jgi:PAS domain S-box-containing protein
MVSKPQQSAGRQSGGLPAAVAEAVFAASTDALLWVDGDQGTVLFANPAAQSLFGLGSLLPTGLRFADLAVRPQELLALIGERRERAPLRYLRRGSGGHFPAEIQIRWLDAEPSPAGLVTIRDITDRLASERAVRNAERRSLGIFGAAPYPILLVNARRQVADANVKAQELYGYGQTELVGMRIGELLESPARARDYDPTVFGRLAPCWHRRRDGSRFLAEATLSIVRAVRGTYTIVIIRDITEEVAIHEQLRVSEERWRFALEGHGEGLWEWQPDSGEFFLAPSFIEQLGYSADELPPRFEAWERLVHPDDLARANRAVLAHLTGETDLIEVVLRVRNRQGSYRWLECGAKTMTRDSTGRALRLIGTVRDVTEERERHLRERLHQEQLMHTTRLASMGEMATVMAHELNQPLAAIGNFAGAAQRRLKGRIEDPDVSAALANIVTLVERAGGVVQRIRDFTRKGERRIESVDLNALVSEIIRLLEPQCQLVGGDIGLELAAQLPAISGDRLQLGQLVLNLVKNGLEAMAESPSPRVLRLETQSRAGGEVELRVLDSGCGLPDQLALDVITPFFTTKPNGLGMGLVICRTIVEHHGGRLWATPRKPRGTAFHVILPAGPAAAGGRRPPR